MKASFATVLFLLIALAGSPPARAELAMGGGDALEKAGAFGDQSHDALSSGRIENTAALAGQEIDGGRGSGVVVEGRDSKGKAQLEPAGDGAKKRKKDEVPVPGETRNKWSKGDAAKVAGAGLLSGLLGYADDGLGTGLLWGAIGLGAAYLMVKGDYGAAGGTAIGSILGTFLGGPIVGSIIGGILGGIIGHFIGESTGINKKKE